MLVFRLFTSPVTARSIAFPLHRLRLHQFFNSHADGDGLRWLQCLAAGVFVRLRLQGLSEVGEVIADAGLDRGHAQRLASGKTTLPDNQRHVRSQDNRMQKPGRLDALGQLGNIPEVLPVPISDDDIFYLLRKSQFPSQEHGVED